MCKEMKELAAEELEKVRVFDLMNPLSRLYDVLRVLVIVLSSGWNLFFFFFEESRWNLLQGTTLKSENHIFVRMNFLNLW